MRPVLSAGGQHIPFSTIQVKQEQANQKRNKETGRDSDSYERKTGAQTEGLRTTNWRALQVDGGGCGADWRSMATSTGSVRAACSERRQRRRRRRQSGRERESQAARARAAAATRRRAACGVRRAACVWACARACRGSRTGCTRQDCWIGRGRTAGGRGGRLWGAGWQHLVWLGSEGTLAPALVCRVCDGERRGGRRAEAQHLADLEAPLGRGSRQTAA